MSLLSLVDHTKTDKQSRHHYLSVYEQYFESYKHSSNILEIGIDKGGSILLWKQYFPDAVITAIDIQPDSIFLPNHRLQLFYETNAYTLQFVTKLQQFFDIIIDDGSHKLEDMLFVLQHYTAKLTANGMLIIEDICCESWKQLLQNAVPQDCFGEFVDCRPLSGVYDSLLFIVKKKNN